MSDKIQPCPFCEPWASNPIPEVEVRGEMIFVFICCHGCYCRGPEINTGYPILVEAAIKAWNRRIEEAKG
jgi:hypothetical protein